MRKTTFIMILMITLTVAVFAEVPTPQTEDSGTLTLIGSVAKKVTIDITPVGDYQTLNLMNDLTDYQVASVNEFSNVRAGYTVSLQSATAAAGSLTNPVFDGGNGDDTLEYTIKYNGSPVTFDAGAEATITDVDDKTPLAGVDKALTISYSGTTVNIYDGTYEDTLTFTIRAN